MISGMSGPALIGKIRESYPSTAVMLMTGFADQSLEVPVPLSEKPFTATALA